MLSLLKLCRINRDYMRWVLNEMIAGLTCILLYILNISIIVLFVRSYLSNTYQNTGYDQAHCTNFLFY